MSARPGGLGRALVGAALVAAAAALSAAVSPLRAQATASAPPAPSLDQVDALIAAGRTEDARAELTAWMGGGSAPAPGRGQTRASRADAQRALWLRALLTVDPVQAAVDYQRLVVEYPGGPFSDRALLRLAQAAQAQGDQARARELLDALVRDYPRSPLRLEAATVLESLPEAAAASARPAPEPLAATPPVSVEPERPRAAAPERRTRAAESSDGPWTIQHGAFASLERAEGLQEELARDDIEARIVLVPGSPLIRVRSGRFPSQPAADRARDVLTARGREATVAGDADREEPAR